MPDELDAARYRLAADHLHEVFRPRRRGEQYLAQMADEGRLRYWKDLKRVHRFPALFDMILDGLTADAVRLLFISLRSPAENRHRLSRLLELVQWAWNDDDDLIRQITENRVNVLVRERGYRDNDNPDQLDPARQRFAMRASRQIIANDEGAPRLAGR